MISVMQNILRPRKGIFRVSPRRSIGVQLHTHTHTRFSDECLGTRGPRSPPSSRASKRAWGRILPVTRRLHATSFDIFEKKPRTHISSTCIVLLPIHHPDCDNTRHYVVIIATLLTSANLLTRLSTSLVLVSSGPSVV